MTAASDSGWTQRAASPSGMARRFAAVSIVLGRTAFTRTPASRTSTASARASATTAVFATVYAAAGARREDEHEELCISTPARRELQRGPHSCPPSRRVARGRSP